MGIRIQFNSKNTMKFILLLATAALVSAKSLDLKQLEYGFCEGAPQPGSIDELTVLPDPLELHTGAMVTITAQLTLTEAIQSGSQVELSIKKNFLGIEIPIPCLEIEGAHIGSCSYDVDLILSMIPDDFCSAHFPQECATPLNPGTYGGGEPLVITIPEIPDIIAGFLGSGAYHASATIKNPDGSMMTCLEVKLDVVG